MTYGHNTDFLGTVIRYNLVHDNLAKGHTAGIYFDHCSHNAIVHHNVVWNIRGMPLQVNNPGYFMLCYNNTLYNSGRIATFDHSHRDDMFGCRFQNNISAAPLELPDHVVTTPNLIDPKPGFVDAENHRFELKVDSPARGAGVPLPGITDVATDGGSGNAPDLGAYPPAWKAGHDFQNPPRLKREYADWDLPEVAFSNAVYNGAFELGTTEGWDISGSGKALIGEGNGWGNSFGRGEVEKTGTSNHELKLTGKVRVEQVIENLHPNTGYKLSAWLKVTDRNSPVILGIQGHGHPESVVRCSDEAWERQTLEFTTGPGSSSVTVFFAQTSVTGTAFADNVGLPRSPRSE